MADNSLGVSGTNNPYITQYYTASSNEKNTLTIESYFKLLAAQLKNQDMTNPMSNSEMMNQMTQMATMNAMTQVSNAIANFGVVTNNLSQVTLTSYSTGMIGREVTVATVDESGEVNGEKKGVVTGVDLTGGQYVYIDGEKYSLSQIMSVGDVPKNGETTPPETEKPETENPETEKTETDGEKC